MARLIGFGHFLCVAIGAVALLGGGAAAAEPLRLVTHLYPPFNELHNQIAPGFSIEVLREVFAAMGREASFEEFPLPRAVMMIRSGQRDGMLAPSSAWRALGCLVPDEPLAQAKWVVFIRTADAGRLNFSSFDDLVGHDTAIVATRPNMAPELSEFLRKHPDNIVRVTSVPQILSMLAAGRVDYAIVNLAVGMRAIAAESLSGKVAPLLSRSVMEDSYSVCFNKARVEPAFVDAFSHTLKQFKETEAFQAIYRKYFQ